MTKLDEMRSRFKRAPEPPEAASDGSEGHTYADVDINGMLPDGQMEAINDAATELGWPSHTKVIWANGHYDLAVGHASFRLPFRNVGGKALVTVPGWSDEVKDHIIERNPLPSDKPTTKFTDDVVDKPLTEEARTEAMKWFDDTLKSRLAPSGWMFEMSPRTPVSRWDAVVSKEVGKADWPKDTHVEVRKNIFNCDVTIHIRAEGQSSEIVITAADVERDGPVMIEIPPYAKGVKMATVSTRMHEDDLLKKHKDPERLFAPGGFESASAVAKTHVTTKKYVRCTPKQLVNTAVALLRKAGWPNSARVHADWADVEFDDKTTWPKLLVMDGSGAHHPILTTLVDEGTDVYTLVEVPFGPNKRLRARRKRKDAIEMTLPKAKP